MSKLTDMIAAAAEQAEKDGVQINGEPNGPVHQWALRNIDTRPGTMFFVVLLLTAAMSDREAQREGFKDQFDRAASKVNWQRNKKCTAK